MNRKLAFAIIGFLIGVIISLSISFGTNVKEINSLTEQLNISKARADMLEYQLIATDKQLKDTKFKLAGANQAVEQLTIKYMADEMYINDLERVTTHMAGYITYVNLTLKGSGIEIPQWIYAYIDENGKVIR